MPSELGIHPLSDKLRNRVRPAIIVPPLAWGGGLAAAVVIGAIAGLVPALRAARMSPTQALWTLLKIM